MITETLYVEGNNVPIWKNFISPGDLQVGVVSETEVNC